MTALKMLKIKNDTAKFLKKKITAVLLGCSFGNCTGTDYVDTTIINSINELDCRSQMNPILLASLFFP
jgi:hypothetical protein